MLKTLLLAYTAVVSCAGTENHNQWLSCDDRNCADGRCAIKVDAFGDTLLEFRGCWRIEDGEPKKVSPLQKQDAPKKKNVPFLDEFFVYKLLGVPVVNLLYYFYITSPFSLFTWPLTLWHVYGVISRRRSRADALGGVLQLSPEEAAQLFSNWKKDDATSSTLEERDANTPATKKRPK